jgi:hypothetical protein
VDNRARLASKLRRRMAELSAYPAQFDFGRLFADTGRVFARAWLPILGGLVVLGIVPAVISAMPWWQAPHGASLDAFHRVWVELNLFKALLVLAAHSGVSTYLTAISLSVLTGADWREMFQVQRLAAGLVTSVCVNLLVSWASFADTILSAFSPGYGILLTLGIVGRVSVVVLAAYIGIAVAAAIAERRFVGSAIVRSAQLLGGLRFRIVAVSLAYLLAAALFQTGLALALALGHVSYLPFSPGRAVIAAAPVLVSGVTTVIFASFFLQARRITDGPTASELHDVFA